MSLFNFSRSRIDNCFHDYLPSTVFPTGEIACFSCSSPMCVALFRTHSWTRMLQPGGFWHAILCFMYKKTFLACFFKSGIAQHCLVFLIARCLSQQTFRPRVPSRTAPVRFPRRKARELFFPRIGAIFFARNPTNRWSQVWCPYGGGVLGGRRGWPLLPFRLASQTGQKVQSPCLLATRVDGHSRNAVQPSTQQS